MRCVPQRLPTVGALGRHATVDGLVKEVHVTTGAMIEPGQVLIVLDLA
jgi:multidrug efflux pump subunit AcrA (membrane-fusion protein)